MTTFRCEVQMLATEKLAKAAKELDEFAIQYPPSVALQKLSESWEEDSGIEFILALIDSATEEVEVTEFKRHDTQLRYLSILKQARHSIFHTLMERAPNSKGPLFGPVRIAEICSIADALGEKLHGQDSEEIDRKEFAKQTQLLIETVSGWDIDQYAKRALLNGLSLTANMAIVEASSASDLVIRRRIKSLVASFVYEFSETDKEFGTKWEAIKRWAAFAFNKSSVPLGLTADLSEIAGLLPKP